MMTTTTKRVPRWTLIYATVWYNPRTNRYVSIELYTNQQDELRAKARELF